MTTKGTTKGITSEEQKIREFLSDKLKDMKDIEYTEGELKALDEEITDINKNKYQHGLDYYYK